MKSIWTGLASIARSAKFTAKPAGRVRTFGQVLHARRNNEYINWYGDGYDPLSAAKRLTSGEFVKIGVDPKFKLSRSGQVFTIGSCFARNIERRLTQAGVAVAANDFALSQDAYVARANPAGALNKYNTHSIESEVLSALGMVSYPNMGLIEAGDGLWWDPLATATKTADYDTVLGIRQKIQAVTKRIPDCEAVIITLGMNEVWQDLETGLYMNTIPPAPVVRKHNDRFGIILSNLQDNMKSLESTINAIRSACNNIKIVITVSPVPMGATLTPNDVIAANTYSKAMLRVCAQAVADKYDFVDYFPSYEMIMNSPRDITWMHDQIHVNDTAVGFVTNYFIEKYLE